MLGRNEPIKGVDLSSAFVEMLDELPWKSLRAIVQANSQLHKRCTAGGHRLDPKQRKRIQKLVGKEAEKADFDSSFTNPVFAVWYPMQADVHETLESYFHSEEYEAHRKEMDIEEERYVLPQEKFDEWFSVEDLNCWRLLLCFSPLEFTEGQAAAILQGRGENQALLDRAEALEESLESARKEVAAHDKEAERLRAEAEKALASAQELRREKKELATEARQLRSQFEGAQVENKKLRAEVEAANQRLHKETKGVEEQRKREVDRLRKELGGNQSELDSWQSRYEEQRVEAKTLQEKLDETRRQLRERDAEVERLNATVQEQNRFADLILERIDWPNLARQMKLTPALRRQFNNLIRSLDYEEDKTLAISGTLEDFWGRMAEHEKTLIGAIASSDNEEVADGSVEEYWQGLTDDFEDVKISLEARAILLKLLQDIFYQTLQMKDLEKPRLPVSTK